MLILCFIFGMIFTPPDIISQFLMAVPMYLLLKLDYYLVMTKKRNLIAKDLRTPKYRLKIEKNKRSTLEKINLKLVPIEPEKN